MTDLKHGKIAGWGLIGIIGVAILIALGWEPSDTLYGVFGIAMLIILPWGGIMLIKNSKNCDDK